MSNNKPSGAIPSEQLLLVEGLNDQHVIWNLAKKYDIPKTFSVEKFFQKKKGVTIFWGVHFLGREKRQRPG